MNVINTQAKSSSKKISANWESNSLSYRKIGILFTCFITAFLWNGQVLGQCPTPCTTHSISASTTTFPLCTSGNTTSLVGDLDNMSDCDDGTDNCFEFIITRPNTNVMGFFADIGQGNNCNGFASIFYTLIDGVCTTFASQGSQNNFNFEFGVSDEMRIYICNNSSGQVSLCGLCADVDCPDPTAIIQITEN